MKVVLYMAISTNGYIAKLNHDTPWTDDELESYSEKVKEVGNLIIGKTTYNIMKEENIFQEIGNPFVVVLTSSLDNLNSENTVFVSSFENALKVLEEKGFSTALVAGGGKANTAALNSGRLEEIYLDVEPHIFGNGIALFAPSDINLQLELVDTKRIGKSGIQLHYRVEK